MANFFLAHTTKKALHEVSTLLKKKVVEIDDVVNLSEFSGFLDGNSAICRLRENSINTL